MHSLSVFQHAPWNVSRLNTEPTDDNHQKKPAPTFIPSSILLVDGKSDNLAMAESVNLPPPNGAPLKFPLSNRCRHDTSSSLPGVLAPSGTVCADLAYILPRPVFWTNRIQVLLLYFYVLGNFQAEHTRDPGHLIFSILPRPVIRTKRT